MDLQRVLHLYSSATSSQPLSVCFFLVCNPWKLHWSSYVWPIFKHFISDQCLSIVDLGLDFHYLSSFFYYCVKGAEWWAQQLGQSIPLFSWVPFVNGKHIYFYCFFLHFFLVPLLSWLNFKFSVIAIQTSRAVLYMMIAFAVIPTVAFKWVFLTWTVYVLSAIGSKLSSIILNCNEIGERFK